MSVFQKLVGKKLLWVGSEAKTEDSSCEPTYFLFEGNIGFCVDDKSALQELKDPKETLKQVFSPQFDMLNSLANLQKLLTEEKKDESAAEPAAEPGGDEEKPEPVVAEGSDDEPA
jgi:hypothetical protein